MAKLTESALRKMVRQELKEMMHQEEEQSLVGQIFEYLDDDEVVGKTITIGELSQRFDAEPLEVIEALMDQEFQFWTNFDDEQLSALTIAVDDAGYDAM